jgi:hypothetical protein
MGNKREAVMESAMAARDAFSGRFLLSQIETAPTPTSYFIIFQSQRPMPR